MARQVIGYTKLEWTCPNCQTVNPGPMKICSSCGAPRPDEVQFAQAAQEELIQDEKEIKQAKAGADITCGYCGAPNPGNAEVCQRCGADLKEGKKRIAGQVIGAHRAGPVANIACPNCGAENPATAFKCSQCGAPLTREAPKSVTTVRKPVPIWVYIFLAAVLIGLIALIATCARREEVSATVQELEWQRGIIVMSIGPVQKEDFKDEIPVGATIGTCRQELHHVQKEPVAGAEEVCGTPYTVDTGSGYGEVVQDCEYRVYKDYCKFTVQECTKVDEVFVQGTGQEVAWPAVPADTDGCRDMSVENYVIRFNTEKGVLQFQTDDYALFSQATVGSQWELTLSGLGGIVDIKKK